MWLRDEAHTRIMTLSPPQYKDLLQLMIDATEEGEGTGGRRLTDEEIVAHSIAFLLAGYETTANTLAYTSYLLALNPEIQEKLQATIDDYFENNPVSWCLCYEIICITLSPSSLPPPHLFTTSPSHRRPPCTMPLRIYSTWTW